MLASTDRIDFTVWLARRQVGPECVVDEDFVTRIKAGQAPVHGIVQLFRLPAMSPTGVPPSLSHVTAPSADTSSPGG